MKKQDPIIDIILLIFVLIFYTTLISSVVVCSIVFAIIDSALNLIGLVVIPPSICVFYCFYDSLRMKIKDALILTKNEENEEFNGRENLPQIAEIVDLDEIAEFYRTLKLNAYREQLNDFELMEDSLNELSRMIEGYIDEAKKAYKEDGNADKA